MWCPLTCTPWRPRTRANDPSPLSKEWFAEATLRCSARTLTLLLSTYTTDIVVETAVLLSLGEGMGEIRNHAVHVFLPCACKRGVWSHRHSLLFARVPPPYTGATVVPCLCQVIGYDSLRGFGFRGRVLCGLSQPLISKLAFCVPKLIPRDIVPCRFVTPGPFLLF